MGELSFEKLLIIAVVILILFGGAKKIPEMMRGLGKGVREFNDAKKGLNDDLNTNTRNNSTAANNTNSNSGITDLEHESVNK